MCSIIGMSEVVIKVENLSKRYQLGSINTGILLQDVNRWWMRVTKKGQSIIVDETEEEEEKQALKDRDFWALKDINFEVKKGEVLGIIGKNGAGKSTLLKILSRITLPTAGQIKVKGHIASLLEVGTGFHPDLTGKENIFLNGAILGMTKREIKSKLDEIIAFSGVERYIETPVKRYSSGMYVRLAFAVAAHLDPEILIIDEALSVGDIEFQRKCMKKMSQIAREGKTVLFVSHSMETIKNLCTHAILLDLGKIYLKGTAKEVLKTYEDITFYKGKPEVFWYNQAQAPGNKVVRLMAVRALNQAHQVTNTLLDNEDIYIEIDFCAEAEGVCLTSSIQLFNQQGIFVLSSGNWPSTTANIDPFSGSKFGKGTYRSRVKIPAYFLNEGYYIVNVVFLQNSTVYVADTGEAVSFTVEDSGDMRKEFKESFEGVIRPKLEWNTCPLVLKNA